jgi:AP-1 complex subunit gamma-1
MDPSVAPAAVTVYDKSGVVLKLSCERPLDASQTITLTATNTSDHDVSSLTLQAAVPKVGVTVTI